MGSNTNEKALREAVESQREPLLTMIKNMIRDPYEAEDVLQDVFAELTEAYELGAAFETLGAWMVRVARNKVLDRFRRRKIQDEYRILVQDSKEVSEVEALDPASKEELREEIILAMEALPPEQQEVFIKHELEGKSYEEIAKETGQSVNTLLSRKRYAVLALRDYLQEVYDETF